MQHATHSHMHTYVSLLGGEREEGLDRVTDIAEGDTGEENHRAFLLIYFFKKYPKFIYGENVANVLLKFNFGQTWRMRRS